MISLCAHLGYQFQEFEPLERFAQAAAAGFRAVEWPAIYGFPAETLRDALDRHGLEWVQVTLPMGAPGEKGLTALPGREAEFAQGLEKAVAYAKALGAKAIHPMSGTVPAWDDPSVRTTYLNNLRLASRVAGDHGLTLLVEVIGDGEVPGYGMCRYERAEEVFDALGEDAPKLILDAYHAQVLTGDVIAVARRWAGRIGHVQIADAPGRHEPGTGAIDFDAFFAVLEAGGYAGWVGCEYRPQTSTLAGLVHLAPYLRPPAPLSKLSKEET